MPFTNRIRLPFKITRPQFPEDRSVYRYANGATKTLSVVIKKSYEGEVDWWPEKWHQRLVIALGHDNITIEGDKYLGGISKDGDYSIDWQTFLDYPTAKAKFSVFVTPFDNTNSNCQTCEEATQVSLQDDTFPYTLHEDTTYTLQLLGNDTVCCYPATISITTYDSDYIASASIDQMGLLTIHTKTPYVSANGIKLLTYRVTCPNGGYDEADVFGDLIGSTPGCLAPSNILISDVTTGAADINFTASPSTPDHYLWRLYKASAPGVIIQTGTSTTTLHLTGLAPGTDYVFYVRSQCGVGNDDATASNFISKPFTTNVEGSLCGQYLLNYSNPFGGSGDKTNVTYLDCNGNYATVFVFNNVQKAICAAQSAPGIPVSIESSVMDPSTSFFVTHGDDTICVPVITAIRIHVGYGTSSGAVCSGTHSVWINSAYSDIAPGVVAYTNSFLTFPLTGQNYIGNLGGEVFNINSSNGLVGATTGIIC